MAHIDTDGPAPEEVVAGAEVPSTDDVAAQADDVAAQPQDGAVAESTDGELDDLADVEFMLEEIEDKIAPLALA